MAHADTNNMDLVNKSEDIANFRQWVQEQKPILNSFDADEFLVRFLRVTDFNIERAKEWLVNYWRYRTENPQWFKDRDLKSPLMRQISQLAYCLQLPHATKNKYLIFLMRLGNYDPAIYSLDDVTRYAFAVTDIINSQPTAQLNGFIILLDFTNIRLQHIGQYTPERVRRYVDCWEKMYPVNLRQIHFYNYPSIFNPILHLFRLFLRQTLSERLYFHSGTSNEKVQRSLHEFIDPAILPSEYGGQLESVESDMHKSFIDWTEQRNDYMIQFEQYGADLQNLSTIMEKIKKESDK